MENLLPLLLLLACPVGMAAMMIFMGKGMKSSKPERSVSLADLKSEQARLDDQINRLEQPRDDGNVQVPSARH